MVKFLWNLNWQDGGRAQVYFNLCFIGDILWDTNDRNVKIVTVIEQTHTYLHIMYINNCNQGNDVKLWGYLWQICVHTPYVSNGFFQYQN